MHGLVQVVLTTIKQLLLKFPMIKSAETGISDKVLAKLIDLCVDICKRNKIEKLIYTGDATGNLTRHNMFAATLCPGPYLQSRFPYIAEEVNKRLAPEPAPCYWSL